MRAIIASAISAFALTAFTSSADAFCGFYVGGADAKMFNNATQVVLMRQGTTTVLSMQNNYQGPPAGFALVVPVPVVIKEGQVKTLPPDVFARIDTLGAPRLVEYWEADPCAPFYPPDEPVMRMALESVSDDEGGDESDEDDYKVTIEAKFSVGEYDVVVLSAQESTGLDRWLRANKYQIPPAAEPLLRPYVEQGTKFFVAKVDPKKVRFVNGMATLSPLRFHYESQDFSLPVRLGLASSNGTQDLIVNVLAPGTRYEVANYPNVTIPTNLLVNDSVRQRFGEFYAALFDHTIAQVPNAVVTEYAWDAMKCDPCPGPTLDANDLYTFGGDVIATTYANQNAAGYTLTRLHARYGKDLKSDLVFRAVGPLAGGVGSPDASGALATKLETTGLNMFQGRYAILHPWKGSVTCAAPQRGRWGGPPAGQQMATEVATNTAFAPRGKVELASMVATMPDIGVLSSSGAVLPIPPRQPRGACAGCSTPGSATSAGLLAVLLGLVLRRRRRVAH